MRTSSVPLVAIGLLAALVFLLPQRERARPLPALPLEFAPLDLVEPPQWALDELDPVGRDFDRLFWAGHRAAARAAEKLVESGQPLAAEILARLSRLGPRSAVPVAKLLRLLGQADLGHPGVLDELVRRAYSESGLIAAEALRLLAVHPDEEALVGIFPRLDDPDDTVRNHARSALALRAGRGDPEALELLLEQLESGAADPNVTYVMALAGIEDERLVPRVDAILERLRDEGSETAWWTAITVQLARRDADAIEKVEHIFFEEEDLARSNAVKACLAAGVFLGVESWATMVHTSGPHVRRPLIKLFMLSVDTGDASAPEAATLLEQMALGRDPVLFLEAASACFARGFPRVVEHTRAELQRELGGALSQVIDRVIQAPHVEGEQFAQIARDRLAAPGLHAVDRVLLLRLLAHISPDDAVDPIVEIVLAGAPESAEQANALVPLLPRLGEAGLERLGQELGQPLADLLYVHTAGQLRVGSALPQLERLILDPDTLPAVRAEAIDTIARLSDGPRADTLRLVVAELGDPAVSVRARLLYWNYL